MRRQCYGYDYEYASRATIAPELRQKMRANAGRERGRKLRSCILVSAQLPVLDLITTTIARVAEKERKKKKNFYSRIRRLVQIDSKQNVYVNAFRYYTGPQ